MTEKEKQNLLFDINEEYSFPEDYRELTEFFYDNSNYLHLYCAKVKMDAYVIEDSAYYKAGDEIDFKYIYYFMEDEEDGTGYWNCDGDFECEEPMNNVEINN